MSERESQRERARGRETETFAAPQRQAVVQAHVGLGVEQRSMVILVSLQQESGRDHARRLHDVVEEELRHDREADQLDDACVCVRARARACARAECTHQRHEYT